MLTEFKTYGNTPDLHLKARIEALYDEYHKELDKQLAKNALLADLKGGSKESYSNITLRTYEEDFERLTGTKFSIANLERAKILASSGELSSIFKDQDFVIAMKESENGFLLRFNSGREIEIDRLYVDSGGFKKKDGFDRVSLPLLDKHEILSLDKDGDGVVDSLDNLAMVIDKKLTLLKDAGVKLVTIQQFKNDRVLMFLEFEDGKKESIEALYKVMKKVEKEPDLTKLQSTHTKKRWSMGV